MNQKSLRTQQQIEKALFKLLQNKTYSEISIAEITRLAQVSRTSFYRHYKEKNDVLKEYLERLYANFIADIQNNHLTTLSQQLSAYLGFFQKNPAILAILLNAGFEGILINEQTIYLKKLLTIVHPELKLADYAIAYQSGGIFMILAWWVKQNYRTPLSELIAYVEKHLNI